MKRALLAAVAAIALTASASAAPRPLDTVVCDITDNKNTPCATSSLKTSIRPSPSRR